MQRGKDIGFILLAGLVLQGNPGKKHPAALFGQLVINILCQCGVDGALAVFIRLLVADKNIKGLFLLGDGEDSPLHLGDFFRILLVLGAGYHIGMLQGRFIVHIL